MVNQPSLAGELWACERPCLTKQVPEVHSAWGMIHNIDYWATYTHTQRTHMYLYTYVHIHTQRNIHILMYVYECAHMHKKRKENFKIMSKKGVWKVPQVRL